MIMTATAGTPAASAPPTRAALPRRRLRLALLGALLALAPALPAQESTPEPLSAFPRSLLAIRTATGKVLNFMIWTADNDRRREQGLMFVREMDDHAGMLFVFPHDERVTMWMKNTYLSLDLVFIDAGGHIEAIAANATPLSEDLISPPQPAHAVLELRGGIAARLGIHAGDQVLNVNLASPATPASPAKRTASP